MEPSEMTPPGLQICLRHRVTVIFDLLTSGSELVVLGSWHQNRFVRFQNIVFARLVTDG